MQFKLLISSLLILFTVGYISYNNKKLSRLVVKSDQIESLKSLPLNYKINSYLTGVEIPVSLDSDKLVLVHFWATWCLPCEREFPLFVSLFKNLDQAKWNIYFIAINDNNLKIKKFLAKHHFPKNLIYTDNSNNHQTLFNVYKVPETLLFSADGRLIKRIVGPQSWDDGRMINFFKQIERKIN